MPTNSHLSEQLLMELSGEYANVFDALRKLESEHPAVARNQRVLSERSELPYLAAVSSLLTSMQDSDEGVPTLSKTDISKHVEAFMPILGMRSVLTSLVAQYYSATVLMIEHLYYLNKLVSVELKRPREDQPEIYHGLDLALCLYPQEKIDVLRRLAINIWSDRWGDDDAV